MCLSSVIETCDHPSDVIIDGWKEIDAKNPRFMFKQNGSYDIPFDKWITATDEHAPTGIKASDGQTYDPGFHAYADEKEVDTKRMQRVFLRGVTCIGKQGGKRAVIARQMYLPSKNNGWPPKPDEENKSLMDRVKNVLPGNA